MSTPPDKQPILTIEMIRRAIEALKKAAPAIEGTYNGDYWMIPKHWMRLFSRN